jgi:hypothetical protein
MSTFEVDEHLRAMALVIVLWTNSIKEVYVYVALYVSGFHPRVCPNAK